MFSAFANAFKTPELRKKILFTLGILALFRLGSTVPTPNVDIQSIRQCLDLAQQSEAAGLYSLVNLFSGGALLQLTVFALGVMPYITASIIFQLLVVVIPRLEALKKEGGSGQQKITQYTRYLTVVLALLNSSAFITLARTGQLFPGCPGNPETGSVLFSHDILSLFTMVMVMTAGTVVIMWLGELITDRGIGNGMSVLIFVQIAASFPAGLWGIKQANPGTTGWFLFFIVVGVGLLVMLGIVFVEQGQRRIPVQYAKRMVGRRLVGGSTTYIPLKVNQAGVIPVIFASSILYMPMLFTILRPDSQVGRWLEGNFSTNSNWYLATMFLLIIGFTYFYVSITFNPEEVSDNMKKYGGFIPGIRAGKPTERYLAYVLSRLTAPGSLYLAVIALIPTVAFMSMGASEDFPFGGVSILIIVGVALDTVKRIESQLQQRNYEGFLR